jgi:MFS family permease
VPTVLPDSDDLQQRDARGERFLKIAWVANFASWFLVGTVYNLFPKLGLELGLEPRTLGYLIALTYLAQILAFLALRRTARWHYRMLPLASCQLLGALGAILIYASTSIWTFACAFALLGAAQAMTYYASLFCSVYAQDRKGAKAGLHESVLATGTVFGALLGGLVAQRFGLRAPYLLCVVVVVLAVGTELALSRRNRAVLRAQPR